MKSRPLSLAQARTAATINQFATPGLGSLMAKRYVAGIAQLMLAVTGFVLVIVWFKSLAIDLYDLLKFRPAPPLDYRLAIAGGLFFVAGWLWALITSLRLLREARQQSNQPDNPDRPPVIEGYAPGPDDMSGDGSTPE